MKNQYSIHSILKVMLLSFTALVFLSVDSDPERLEKASFN
jgi:hypothetical protein